MRNTRDFLVGLAALGGAYWLAHELVRRRRWFDFAGKVVFIAGGSRGLGLVLARQLDDRGAKVAIFARTEADVLVAESELRRRGGEVQGIVGDVRNQDEVQSAVEHVRTRLSEIDVLLHVAGIMQVGPLDTMRMEDFHEAMDINCWGALHTALAVIPEMRRRRWGRIVNVASIGGKRAVPHMLPYDTSKFALVGLSTGLRAELAKDGILVTTVCPSLMRTGSPRNAIFKGQHRLEYAWFSIGGSLPVAAMSAEQAAAQILRACQDGAGEVFISNYFSPPMLAAKFLPALTAEVLAIVNQFLPEDGGIGTRSAFGYESESALSPSVLTSLGDAAARKNNEMRPRRKGP